MIDSTSFTSEPQYQRPDNRNSDMNFEPKPPLVIPLPPKRTLTSFSYDVTLPERFFGRLGHDIFRVGRLDYFGNAIPLGAFCFAITFITYGFYRCKVYTVNETFLWSVILIFGSLGQITAGCLEYIKARHFPALIYLCFGFYCLSHYVFYVYPKHMVLTGNDSMTYMFYNTSVCAFYSAWVVISFAVLIMIIYHIYVNSSMIVINPILNCKYSILDIDYLNQNGKQKNGLMIVKKEDLIDEEHKIKIYPIGFKLYIAKKYKHDTI